MGLAGVRSLPSPKGKALGTQPEPEGGVGSAAPSALAPGPPSPEGMQGRFRPS